MSKDQREAASSSAGEEAGLPIASTSALPLLPDSAANLNGLSSANSLGDGNGNSNTPLPPLPPEIQAALIPRISPPRPPRQTLERTDERCWVRCRQTNARRALGREPKCTAWCYINMRKQLAALTPVPGLPGAYHAVDQPIPAPLSPTASTSTPSPKTPVKEDPSAPPELPSYRWPWLDGRYVYRACGRELVANHMMEMGAQDGVEQVKKIEKRCEASELERQAENTREKRVMRRAMGIDGYHDQWETITSLSELYSTSLGRFHNHLVRIYSPGIRNLLRLPSTFTDGTQSTMLQTVYTRLTDGSAFKLADRMLHSTQEVVKRLRERSSSSSSGSGSGGPPVGGLEPPVLSPPAGEPRPASSGLGGIAFPPLPGTKPPSPTPPLFPPTPPPETESTFPPLPGPPAPEPTPGDTSPASE